MFREIDKGADGVVSNITSAARYKTRMSMRHSRKHFDIVTDTAYVGGQGNVCATISRVDLRNMHPIQILSNEHS